LRLPDYHLVNMSVTWNMPFGLTLLANLNNLTNETYIERGKDGADHTLESFRGYWGFGINGSLGLRVYYGPNFGHRLQSDRQTD
ncbi:MAG TPA: TonB-dependent receptor, partial [Bacteroidales bacterium]|nr:TonB-dependent receptor [Bacteroidales bacterium]